MSRPRLATLLKTGIDSAGKMAVIVSYHEVTLNTIDTYSL
jgi:hypothetical protein